MRYDPFVENDKEAWLDLSDVYKFDGNWAVHYLMYHLAKLIKARETIEIGVGRGHGTYMLGLHAKEVGGRHTAIDINHVHANRATHIKNTFDLPVDVILGDSKLMEWNKKICLIYIDGGHSTEQVIGDVDNFGFWVKRQGVMIFDDYGKKHLGVTEAVDFLYDEDSWEQITFPYFWWTIWRKK